MRKIETPPVFKLHELMDIGTPIILREDVRELLNSVNEEYLFWDKVKYKRTPEDLTHEKLWAAIKLSRLIHAKKIRFGSYTFQYNLSDTIQSVLHSFDLNIGGQLGASGLLAEDNKKQYLISSVMEEAIASSQIEGAVTTRKEAKEMLRKNKKPRTKSEQMIINNYITIRHILDIQNQEITVEKLLEVHKLIANQTLDEESDEGKFREKNDVKVVDAIDGEVVHIPPHYKEIPGLMQELCDFFNKEDKALFIHPIIKGCIIHFMIGFIHPFVDGNGRTARALFYWYLLSKGYWLTEYLSISRLIVRTKNQYAKAYIYSEQDENDLTYFIKYKLKTMTLAYDSLRKYMQRKISEKKKLFEFQKLKGVNERQAQIIKWIYEEGDLLLYTKEIETRLNISNQTARVDLNGLVELGYLEEINVNKKQKAFCKSKNFDTLIEVPVKLTD